MRSVATARHMRRLRRGHDPDDSPGGSTHPARQKTILVEVSPIDGSCGQRRSRTRFAILTPFVGIGKGMGFAHTCRWAISIAVLIRALNLPAFGPFGDGIPRSCVSDRKGYQKKNFAKR